MDKDDLVASEKTACTRTGEHQWHPFPKTSHPQPGIPTAKTVKTPTGHALTVILALVAALVVVGCQPRSTNQESKPMKTKKVKEQLGVAEFEIPADWKELPSTEDSSVQYYPEDADVVMRTRAMVFDAPEKGTRLSINEVMDKLAEGDKAKKGKTKDGHAWQRLDKQDQNGSYTHWYVADAQDERLVVLVYTYSYPHAADDPRSAAHIATGVAIVDSTHFLKAN